MNNNSKMSARNTCGSLVLLAASCIILTAPAIVAQVGTTSEMIKHKSEKAPLTKPLEFEVVSIRASKSTFGSLSPTGIVPDGYQAINKSLGITVMQAYLPGMIWGVHEPQGLPPWTRSVMYDVVAKVAPSDIAMWQKQGPKQEMLRTMLQTMLADRCKLVAHTVAGNVSGHSLVIGKHGQTLKEAKSDETLPSGLALPGGGVVVGYKPGEKPQVRFFGVTMESFAAWLMQSSIAHPVVNATGLTGRYDFILSQNDVEPSSDATRVSVSLNNEDPSNVWNIEALGLKLVPVNVPAETLVVDHIERPSAN